MLREHVLGCIGECGFDQGWSMSHSCQPLSYFATILSKTYAAKQLNRMPPRCWTNFHHEMDSIRFDSIRPLCLSICFNLILPWLPLACLYALLFKRCIDRHVSLLTTYHTDTISNTMINQHSACWYIHSDAMSLSICLDKSFYDMWHFHLKSEWMRECVCVFLFLFLFPTKSVN